MFLGESKENIRKKELKLQETKSIVNITKFWLNLYISFILWSPKNISHTSIHLYLILKNLIKSHQYYSKSSSVEET